MQFTFNFDGKPEIQFLMDEVDLAHHEIAKLRKSFFVRHNALEKMVKELQEIVFSNKETKVIDLPLFEYAEKRKEA